jgi:hypothetical protein
LAKAAAKSSESSMALMASLNETAPLLYDYVSSFLASLMRPMCWETVFKMFSVSPMVAKVFFNKMLAVFKIPLAILSVPVASSTSALL